MKLGILNAIHPAQSRVNWDGSPIDAYIRFFDSAVAGFEYAGYEVAQGEFPISPDECDAYVITGSPRGVYNDDDWIPRLSQFIRDSYDTGRRLIGICFGHQIIAHALGGHVEKSERGWRHGLHTFSVTKSKPWMNGRTNQCSLYFAHQDQVTKLPPGAEYLGGDEFCPNTFYTIEGRVLGIQGHPEFSAELMKGIIELAQNRIGSQRYEAAIQSLNEGDPDNLKVAQWMVNFLTADEIHRP